jgi:hypothetical protein
MYGVGDELLHNMGSCRSLPFLPRQEQRQGLPRFRLVVVTCRYPRYFTRILVATLRHCDAASRNPVLIRWLVYRHSIRSFSSGGNDAVASVATLPGSARSTYKVRGLTCPPGPFHQPHPLQYSEQRQTLSFTTCLGQRRPVTAGKLSNTPTYLVPLLMIRDSTVQLEVVS